MTTPSASDFSAVAADIDAAAIQTQLGAHRRINQMRETTMELH